MYAAAPAVPTANGVSTYYNSTDNTWHYVVVPFQTAWQSGDSDDLSGRTWLTQTSYAAVIAHLDGGTYDSTLTYAYYAADDDAIYEVASFTDSVAAVAASLTDRDLVTADLSVIGGGTYQYLGAFAAPPPADSTASEIYYGSTTQLFHFHNVSFSAFNTSGLSFAQVGFDRRLGHFSEADAIAELNHLLLFPGT